MSSIEYRDPIAQAIIEKLKLHCDPAWKNNYYYGTPMVIAQNQLKFPAICTSMVDDLTSQETSSHDGSSLLYRITVITDMKEQWLTGKDRVGAEMRVHEILVGRDQNFDMLGTLAEDKASIEYVLRRYKVIDGNGRLYLDLGSETNARIRPNIEGRGRGMFLYEGQIDFRVRHNQISPYKQHQT